jgi:hypothetical protein
MRSREELFAAYLKTRSTPNDDVFWAYEEMRKILERSAGEAIDVTLALIDACQTDDQLCYVAAGPVEDLLCAHAEIAFPIFANASRGSPKVRFALRSVILEESDEVYPQWKALLVEYGLWEAWHAE